MQKIKLIKSKGTHLVIENVPLTHCLLGWQFACVGGMDITFGNKEMQWNILIH